MDHNLTYDLGHKLRESIKYLCNLYHWPLAIDKMKGEMNAYNDRK